MNELGGRYGSVDLSAPTILRSQVRIPSMPYMLFIVKCCTIFVIVLRKGQKEAGFGPFFKKKK